MKILSLIDIIGGDLLNSPSISSVYSFYTKSSKVKEASLFFAKTKEDALIALNNGAFAIVYEKDFFIEDKEIALIKVKNLDLSMIKLLRFLLSTLNLKAYSCDKISYDLLNIYQNNMQSKAYFLSENIEDFFDFIDEIKDEAFLFSFSKVLLDKIYPRNLKLSYEIEEKDIKNLTEHSLFESSFSYKDEYFSRIKLATLYLKPFLNIYDKFLKDKDLTRLKYFSNLKAIFLDKNLKVVDFGKSNRFVICQDDCTLFEDEIIYIKEKYKYAKSIFVSKKRINFLKKEENISINKLENLKELVSKLDFNCLYLLGFSYKETLVYFQETKKEEKLF